MEYDDEDQRKIYWECVEEDRPEDDEDDESSIEMQEFHPSERCHSLTSNHTYSKDNYGL
jgi:hypothetical protein